MKLLYNIFTQWLTLGVIFFISNYIGSFIEVVTLGGLVAGSFIIAVVTTLVEYHSSKSLPYFTGKAAVYCITLLTAQLLCTFMPGYSMKLGFAEIGFLVVYSALATLIGSILRDITEQSAD